MNTKLPNIAKYGDRQEQFYINVESVDYLYYTYGGFWGNEKYYMVVKGIKQGIPPKLFGELNMRMSYPFLYEDEGK